MRRTTGRRRHLHFMATSSCWLNLIEPWFKELAGARTPPRIESNRRQTACGLRVAGQAQQPLGDDVELHLGGAAVDRGGATG